MRMILIEKNPDCQFTSDSKAILKLNSLIVPNLLLNGVMTLQYKLYMKPVMGDLLNLDIKTQVTKSLAEKGVLLLGSYLEHDILTVLVYANNIRIQDGQDAFIISFYEKVNIKSVEL